MKWKNKGFEFEECAQYLLATFGELKRCYIFGAGLLGKEIFSFLQLYECKVVFIDNDNNKQKSGIEKSKVISLEEYLKVRDGKIIVAASAKNTPVIIRQLEQCLLKHGLDFWLYDEFINYVFPIISTYYYDKSYVSLAQITLTERCTLKCKKCAHGCFAVDSNNKDLTIEQVCKSADSFFSKIDFIREFVLIGGEPLLYKELAQAIFYIGKRYRKQIGIYSITTNGTIIPNEEVLKACKKYNVLFRISNYSQQVSRLKDSYNRLVDILEAHQISFILGNEEREWVDYGFDYVNRNATAEELIKVFDECRTSCREIRENKFYYCVMARSVSDNLKFNIGQDDYLDLDKLVGENYKKELLEFTLGYSEKGYLDMCSHCNGAEAKLYPIPAAVQVR